MVEEVTLSSKNQIVVPKDARKALGLKPGAKINVIVMGKTAILVAKPKNPVEALRGAAKGLVYPPDYLKRERESW